jgi:CHAT domain-containing protein/tetratricopeptide (TPR) repeat protein
MRPGPRLERVVLLFLFAGAAGFPLTAAAAAQPERSPIPTTPPWKRPLSGEAASRVAKLEQQIAQLQREGRFAEAIEPAREAAEIRTRLQGADHWQTADARRAVDDLRTIAALPEEGRKAMASVGELDRKAQVERQRVHYADAERIDRILLEIRRKWLGDDHPDTAQSHNSVAFNLNAQGKYTEAEPLFRHALAIKLKALGEDHPDTALGYNNVAFTLDAQGKSAAAEPLLRKALAIQLKALGENHPDTALSYNNLAGNLNAQGKYTEAEPLLRKALAINLKARGDNHPYTATSYNNLAANLNAQGKSAEAEPLFRQALAIRLKALGENHPDTALGYNNVAFTLNAQGKYTEAEPVFRKALAIYLKVLGENHPKTAQSYNNLALNLDAQGKSSEAEPLCRKALAIKLKALGENHPGTATSYNSVAANQDAQGKYAEAEPLYRQALAIKLKALGENHPDTARSYNGVAFNLQAQGKYAEAESLFRHALAIKLKALGENHPETALGYNNVAFTLNAQGKYTAAEPLFRKALAIQLKVRGENHPDTARSYNNLAYNLDAQEKYTEAEPLYRKALAIWLKALGENHPDTARSHNNLAYNLDAQGKLGEAVANWTAAAAISERIRGTQSASGLERSLTPLDSPQPALAIALARRGQPRDAWDRWEADLARGLLDELSARQLRPLTTEQRRREAELAGQLQRLDEHIARLASKPRRTQDQDQQLEALRTQQSTVRGQWVEFQNALDRQYPAATGKPSALEVVQQALPRDTALVGWLDIQRRHWVCLVRAAGAPVWVPTPGSGAEGLCTPEDHRRDRDCQLALATRAPGWRDLAAAVARQRLGPLRSHLGGVKHLVVLPPTPTLAALPVEALVAALPDDSPRPVVSYAPSGSMLARLSTPRSQPHGPPRLLALGDPAFPKPAPSGPPPTPPDHGIAILAVVPQSTADLFGIKPGDVLLEYNGKVLKSQSDLAIVPAGAKAPRVPIKFWRDGEVRSLEIAAGRLGIQSNPNRPAAQVILARRAAAEVLTPSARGENLAPLPGTRREVQAIAALFPGGQATTLVGQDATESNLQQLAQSGALKTYRYIHLATHGKANPIVALSSAVFLAAEPERPASGSTDPAVVESAPDGRITAEQIVRTWDLDAELVVLSACESGLGRYAGGEGYLGFAQALFVKGARSLILSQWKVEDKATALLMARFYQNLLGQRSGLSRPLPKAEALDEAKRWLRELTVDEVGTELAALDHGAVRPLARADGPAPHDASRTERVRRGLGGVAAKLPEGGRIVPPSTPKATGVRPYAHPYYWASFLLIGDPR